MASSSPRSRGSRSSARARPAHQPFNIGKWSSVAKASTSSLALDPEEAAEVGLKPSDVRAFNAQTKGKGKGKSVKIEKDIKAKVEDDDDIEEESVDAEDDNEDEDFAMDSDEEEKQVQRAIKASKTNAGKAGSGSRGVRKTASKGKTRVTGLNSRALRQAVARAAESRPLPFRWEVGLLIMFCSQGQSRERDRHPSFRFDLPTTDNQRRRRIRIQAGYRNRIGSIRTRI